MEHFKATVVSVHVGDGKRHGKEARRSITVELDGVVGDRHRSYKRETYDGDKQPKGTVRRNERQWSAMSVEEIAEIATKMDLAEPLTAAELGANLCLQGVPELSRLPMGTTLRFPSGAELMVSEYNPPCLDKGTQLASRHLAQSGAAIENTAFPKAAKLTRGIVGVVEVPGIVQAGDEIDVTVYAHPSWLARSSS